MEVTAAGRAVRLTILSIPVSAVLFIGVVFLIADGMSFRGDPNLRIYQVAWAVLCLAGGLTAAVASRLGWQSRGNRGAVAALTFGVVLMLADLGMALWSGVSAYYYTVNH